MTIMADAAVAAIQFALDTDDGLNFLSLWNEGEFDVLRKEWPDAPEAIYVGADPLYIAHSKSDDVEIYVNQTMNDLDAKEVVESSGLTDELKEIACNYYSVDALKRANQSNED